jgi:hypothetical protein
VVCIETSGVSAASAAAAAAVAGQRGLPLVVGVDNAIALGLPVTWLVGPEAIARADEVPGGFPIRGATKEDVAISLATAAIRPRDRAVFVRLAPSGAPDVSVGLAGEGGVLLYHPDGQLGSAAYRWIHNHQVALAGAFAGGTLRALGDGGLYDLQSALNRGGAAGHQPAARGAGDRPRPDRGHRHRRRAVLLVGAGQPESTAVTLALLLATVAGFRALWSP